MINSNILKITVMGLALIMILGGLNISVSKNADSLIDIDTENDFTEVEIITEGSLLSEFEKEEVFSNSVNNISFVEPKRNEFIPGQFIIKFKKDVEINIQKTNNDLINIGISSIDNLNRKHKITSIEKVFKNKIDNFDSYGLSNVYKFILSDESNIFSVMEEYAKDPNIVYVEPNFLVYCDDIPNDPDFNEQWDLHNTGQTGGTFDADIDAPEAWEIETGNSDVIIAIVDTGVDYTHSDLAENIWINDDEIPDNNIDDDGNGFVDDIRGWDFYNDDPEPMDGRGHGTHCAGIVSAVGNNSIGISGVSWNCTLMPVKFLSNVGTGFVEDGAKAIVYAIDNGADVISNSWGYPWSSYVLKDAIDYAYGKGAILTSGAGNSNGDDPHYPAMYPKVIAVAATNHNNTKAGFSSYGFWVDVSAPGEDIYSTVPGNGYEHKSGTSMAGPHVAGLAGLLFSKNQSYTRDVVVTIIRGSSDPVNSSVYIGNGKINAYDALTRNPALAIIDSEAIVSDVNGVADIIGAAWGTSFQYYTVEYGEGLYPETWIEIVNSSSSVLYDVLCSIDSTILTEGYYTILLTVHCDDGIYKDSSQILINNIANTFYVDDDGGADFDKIQDAIDNAGAGDSVYVYNGMYIESLLIERGINLTGESNEQTRIIGGILVVADEVQISQFKITSNAFYSSYPPISLNFVENTIITKINIVPRLSQNIFLYYSNSNIISDCKILNDQHNSNSGIDLFHSDNNVIFNNSIGENNIKFGILLVSSKNNTVNNNTVSNSKSEGIYLSSSNYNLLYDNHMIDCGLYLDGTYLSDYLNEINTSNTVNDKPIYYYINETELSIPSDAGEVILVNCSTCVISQLTINGGSSAVQLIDSNEILVTNNYISNVSTGVLISNSNVNQILNNTIFSVSQSIKIWGMDNMIQGNTISNSVHDGVYINNSDNNTLCDNVINDCRNGIFSLITRNCNIFNNTIIDCSEGIEMMQSRNNVLWDNQMFNCSLKIGIGYTPESEYNISDFWHNINTSNMVNNKPVYYFVNKTNENISSDAGQIILINSSEITISNIAIYQTLNTIQIIQSSGCVIKNSEIVDIFMISSDCNTIENNIFDKSYSYGIYLISSCNNSIKNNIITNGSSGSTSNYIGIYLTMNSNYNTINRNTISNLEGTIITNPINYKRPAYGIRLTLNSNNNNINENIIYDNIVSNGIYLGGVQNNTIRGNTLQNNTDGSQTSGIFLQQLSRDNILYHNIFINNSIEEVYGKNAMDHGNNIWDKGHTAGGNYWDDYSGEDTDDDGIGDITYQIPGGDNTDNYPLMNYQMSYLTTLTDQWILISIPINEPILKEILIVYYNDVYYSWQEAVQNNIVIDFVYGWDNDIQGYEFVDVFEPGCGYWIYSYENCELWIRGLIPICNNDYNINLNSMWNLNGFPCEISLDKQDIVVNTSGVYYTWQEAVQNSILIDFVYGWNSTVQGYEFVDVFEPGCGYWIYAYENCDLEYSDD